jgi:hypothetical protein
LKVAADAQDKSFIATQCCVEAMYNIWYDKLHPDQTRKRDKLNLFVGFISLGFLAPVVVSYREAQEVRIILNNDLMIIFILNRHQSVKL